MTAALVIAKHPLQILGTRSGRTLAGLLRILPFGLGHPVAEDDGRRQEDGGDNQSGHGEGHRPTRESGNEGDDEGDRRDRDAGVADALPGVGQARRLGPALADRVIHVSRSISGTSRDGRSASEKWASATAALWSRRSGSGTSRKAAIGAASSAENQRNPNASSSLATG